METVVERGQAQEDRVTGAIESVTSQAPVIHFTWASDWLNGHFTHTAAVYCTECSAAVCPAHGDFCQLCKSFFCSACLCLGFHSHSKMTASESRGGRKIA